MTTEERIKVIQAMKLNPIWGIESLFNCILWDKQKEIVKAVLIDKERKTAVRSCHASGKDFISGRIAPFYLLTNPDSLVITTAPGWTQIKEILWREIREAFGRMGSKKEEIFGIKNDIGTTKFEIDSKWFAIGLAAKKDAEAEEVASRMLGFHSSSGKVLIIVDEGSGVREDIFGAIEGLMTSAYAQELDIGNPYTKTGTFAKRFFETGVKKIHITYTDIPNIKEGRVVVPGLMSPDYPKEMADKYGEDSDIYRVKVKGDFPRAESDTLISIDQVEASFLREVSPVGEKVLGVDVARFGNDMTVLIVRQGGKVIRKESYSKEDTMQTVGRILSMINSENIKPSNVNIDDVGLGGGVVDRLHEKELGVHGVNVGMAAGNDEEFSNLRAEKYWALRNWIKTGSLPKDDDFYQLANIKYKYSSVKKGQIKIESKDEMKKRGLHSPDVADALMLTFVKEDYEPLLDEDVKDDEGDFKSETAGLMDMKF